MPQKAGASAAGDNRPRTWANEVQLRANPKASLQRSAPQCRSGDMAETSVKGERENPSQRLNHFGAHQSARQPTGTSQMLADWARKGLGTENQESWAQSQFSLYHMVGHGPRSVCPSQTGLSTPLWTDTRHCFLGAVPTLHLLMGKALHISKCFPSQKTKLSILQLGK